MIRSPSTPKYRLHKYSGRAVVTLSDGHGGRKDHYLGDYDSPASHQEYNRLVSEWLATKNIPQESLAGLTTLTVNELLAAYWRHAQSYYVKNGEPTSEVDTIRQAIRFVKELYGHSPARDFGPLALRAVRDAMVAHKVVRQVKETDPQTGETRQGLKVLRVGLARKYINAQISRIRAIWQWAVGQELLPAEKFQALKAVEGLRRGKTEAREKAPIRSVADALVEKTLPHLPPIVADMVRVQKLCGCRPGELVQMRFTDMDRSGKVWEFRPGRHKGEHHDRDRIIFLGPRAQSILGKYLSTDLAGPIFRPDQAEQLRNERRRGERKTPRWPAHERIHEKRRSKRPRRVVSDQYDVAAYRRAITRACEKAVLPAWTPHQLRHTAATAIRKRFGLEGAQAVLGHAELETSQIYAEKNLGAAARIMAEMG